MLACHRERRADFFEWAVKYSIFIKDMETQGHFQCPITCLTQVSIGWMVKHLCMFQHCFMSHLLDNTLTAFSSNMFKCLCLKYEERYNLVVGVAVVACNGIG